MDFIKINKNDNVAAALKFLKAGSAVEIDGAKIILKDDIPFGHKFAVCGIAENQNVIKYGNPIGHSVKEIEAGQWIHTHNLKTNLSDLENYIYQKDKIMPQPALSKFENAKFYGYLRKDGQVGIRNEIWIIPLVGCVNTTAKILEKRAAALFEGKTDGIFAYTHQWGCSQMGQDQLTTQITLKGLINNPNCAAVLVLGLGCENNNVKAFEPLLGDYDRDRVKFLISQEEGDEIEEGLKIISGLVEYSLHFKREEFPASHLTLGFKCGGSDGFSGITANPLCGRINDILVSLGGKTILTETPEMFGAERLLMNRAKDEAVFKKIVSLINNFKKYFIRHKQTIYENPSPGNKEGGISTLEEKSLGCIQKGGLAEVNDVLEYGQKPERGLNLLTGPGNDMVSCANLTACGAQMILFTTGRGNPFGAPVPTVKISSNTALYKNKKHWIDFDAGEVLENSSFDAAAEKLFYYILDLASGKIQSKNEIAGYREIAIFKDGVIL